MALNNFKDQKSTKVSDYGKTSEQLGNLHHPDNYNSIEKTSFCFAIFLSKLLLMIYEMGFKKKSRPLTNTALE